VKYRPLSLQELVTILSEIPDFRGSLEEVAKMILDYFGFENFVLDNFLEKEDRKLFYRLEEEGVLKAYAEESYLPVNGAQWRSHFWILDLDLIRERRRRTSPVEEEVYEGVFEEIE